MSRTRTRERTKNIVRTATFYYDDGRPPEFQYLDQFPIIRSEEITDVNNGRARPESAVVHSRATFLPYPYTWRDTFLGGSYTVTNELPPGIWANDWRAYFHNHVARECSEAVESLLFRFYQERASLVKRKDTINFLSELRDLPSMFKSLDKYRYLDWEFGWNPFLRDLTSILSTTESTMESVKAKIKSSSGTKNFSISETVDVSFRDDNFTWAPGFPNSVLFEGTAKVTIRGTYRVMWPSLEDNNNLARLRLDIEGFNADPATLWEAVPFSWLVDWFLPIGNFLEGISGSNFNPLVVFSGTLTVKSQGTLTSTASHDHQFGGYKYGDDIGMGRFSYYSRSPIGDTLDSMFFRPPELKLPFPDFRKIGILNDIFGSGSSIVDAKKLKHERSKERRRKSFVSPQRRRLIDF